MNLEYFGTSSIVSCFAFPSPKLSHDRLVHPHLSKLKKMVHKNKYKNNLNAIHFSRLKY